MTNSRRKGKEGELELSHILAGYGFDTRRGQQYSGATGDADVIGVPGIHIECKRCETTMIDDWMEQSIRDAREGEVPVVMHRRSRKPWKATMLLDDYIKQYQELLTLRKHVKELKMAVADLITGGDEGGKRK